MKEYKSGFTWFYYFIFFDDATEDAKKHVFLMWALQKSRRLPLLFRQAGIIIFQLSSVVYCNNLRTNVMYNRVGRFFTFLRILNNVILQ